MNKYLFREVEPLSNYKHVLKIMKITLFFLFFGILVSYAENSYSQENKLTINLKSATIREVCREIEKKSDYKFVFAGNANEIINKRVNVTVNSQSIKEILDNILSSTELSYQILGDQIAVYRDASKESVKKSETTASAETTQQDNTQQISGLVTDINGVPIIGANISVTGTTVGTVTDIDGRYSLTVTRGSVLHFSYIGYVSQDFTITNQTILNVKLLEDTEVLDDLVVTALGIKRDTKALSYSVSQVKGEDLANAKETNVANALSGKVAGVFVSRPASGAAGSSKVLIRGNNSIRTNSQPLYVVDGLPIVNNSTESASQWGGFDYGDGISNINPDDIESMSVLKGPNATALYGQRGANGVILITTKSGKNKKTLGINFSSDFSVGNPLVIPDFQDVYGQGYNGTFTHLRGNDGQIYSWAKARELGITGIPKTSAGRDKLTRGNWGAKMEGQEYEDHYGYVQNFNPKPNTYDYFRPEKTNTNNISIDGGTDKMNYRFSASNTINRGYVPTNDMDRYSFNLKATANVTDKFQVEGMVNYINQNVKNRPRLSDANDNPAYLFISMPRNISIDDLQKMSWTKDEISRQLGFSSASLFEGLEKTYATNSSTANPYWTINKQFNRDTRDRLIGYLKLSYQLAPWLRFTGKSGTDYYVDNKLFWRAQGTYASPNKNGDLQEYTTRVRETNSDILFLSNFKFLDEKLDLNLNAGGSMQKYSSRKIGSSGIEFIVPDLHAITNLKTTTPIFELYETAINSLYGSGQIAFDNYLYIDFSARNDWSSTLPIKNSSYFYPSTGVGFIVSEAFNLTNEKLNFLKLRASVAQAGSSGGPYLFSGNYYLNSQKFGETPVGYYSSSVVSPDLKNELTTSYEGGVDANFFNNRLGLNFTMYKSSTKNQILSVPLPSSTTFQSRVINAGEIQNQGVELLITGTPIQTNDFKWETIFNFSRNRNKVISLVDGVDSYILAQDRGIYTVAQPGEPFGQLIGVKFAWIKDDQGNRLIDPDTGLPLRTNGFVQTTLGNALPNWLGGLTNNFIYKGFRLSALIDISQGGKIFSQSLREEILYGTTKKTLPGRDGTYVAEGMIAKKDANGDWVSTGVRNTKQVNAQDYWNVVATDKENFVSEEMIDDLSYISMREISLSYTFPSKILTNSVIKSASVGLYGRNLFYFQRKTDGYSPEASSFNVHNSSLGIESTSLPMMRNIGMTVSIGF